MLVVFPDTLPRLLPNDRNLRIKSEMPWYIRHSKFRSARKAAVDVEFGYDCFWQILLIKSVIWVVILPSPAGVALGQGLLTARAALFGGFGRLEVDISVMRAWLPPDPVVSRPV